MSSPFYDLVLVAHVASAVVGFGAVGVGGLSASSAARSPDPAADESVVRFFRAGTDWPSRLVFLVPVLGLGLLFGADRPDVRAVWPWVGLAIWIGAAGVATGWCWPAERRAQELLAGMVTARRRPGADDRQGSGGEVAEFRRLCREMERAVGVMVLCFVAATAVMILQP